MTFSRATSRPAPGAKSIGGAGRHRRCDARRRRFTSGAKRLSLRDIAPRLVISTGKKKGQHPSPATVMRMLREHDEKTAAAVTVG